MALPLTLALSPRSAGERVSGPDPDRTLVSDLGGRLPHRSHGLASRFFSSCARWMT
jgi:hypothetical protein